MENLTMRDVGLIRVECIEDRFPSLVTLDLQNNKIFSIDAVDILYKLTNLLDVNYLGNPVCVHNHLPDMIKSVHPQIERINKVCVRKVGDHFREQTQKIKDELGAALSESLSLKT